jgi:hypothetical protein
MYIKISEAVFFLCTLDSIEMTIDYVQNAENNYSNLLFKQIITSYCN